MKTVTTASGIITLSESKAICPHCRRCIPLSEIESKNWKWDSLHLRMLCKCRKYIGIATDMKGDYIAFKF